MEKEGNLFADDPLFKQRVRDSKGRFATPERAAYDKARKENMVLRYQVEKYKRMALSSTSFVVTLQHIIENQKILISQLRQKKAQKSK